LGLALDELKDNEEVSKINGLDVLMDESVSSLSRPHTVDYVKNAMGEGFTILPENGSGCC